ncbi:MAG: membrane protein insertion efficiency factor YidD [Desulfovibrionaceae bacterium]|nr:membrane protein insertion efficiency factor YidD [Desulfovibrionaceae bacterium]MBF0514317.1 membrane protein insertion efficiency factor YidD [Desulfovibrionaceae bacterium]
MRQICLGLLRFYKLAVSPLLGPACRFYPSCSDYAGQAVSRFGAARGSLLALWRLARCHPLARGGFDPVPEVFSLPVFGRRSSRAFNNPPISPENIHP